MGQFAGGLRRKQNRESKHRPGVEKILDGGQAEVQGMEQDRAKNYGQSMQGKSMSMS